MTSKSSANYPKSKLGTSIESFGVNRFGVKLPIFFVQHIIIIQSLFFAQLVGKISHSSEQLEGGSSFGKSSENKLLCFNALEIHTEIVDGAN